MAPAITFPPQAVIEILDGSNWPSWSSHMLALLQMNGLWDHVLGPAPATPSADWTAQEGMLLGVLEVYIQKDVWIAMASDTAFPTCKAKWDDLKHIYGGVGQMLTFNVWISLTGTALDESKPMLPQLQKLNDARAMLSSNNMKITDLQFSFILLKALPESYSTVATAVLAGGVPSLLTLLTVQERILNEES